MPSDGRSQAAGTQGTEAEAEVKFKNIKTGNPATAVTDDDDLLLAKFVGEDGNGNIRRLATDQSGRLKVKDIQFDGTVNIGDLQILDDNENIIHPAENGTVQSVADQGSQNQPGIRASGGYIDPSTSFSVLNSGVSISVPNGKAVTIEAKGDNSSAIDVRDTTNQELVKIAPGKTLEVEISDISNLEARNNSTGDQLQWFFEG